MPANMPRMITAAIAVIAAVTGRSADLSEEQILALAVGVFGLYQLVGRYVLHRQTSVLNLDLPDPRSFFMTTTAWSALGNAGLGLAILFGADQGTVLPTWFLPLAQIVTLALGQDRSIVAQTRLTDRKARRSLT